MSKASNLFRKAVNSPIAQIVKFFTDVILTEDLDNKLGFYIREIQTGKTPPTSEKKYFNSPDIAWVKPSDIGHDKYISAVDAVSNVAVLENKATLYKPNSVLIICIGAGIGRLGIVKEACSSNQQITGILFTNTVIPEYVYYYYSCRYKIFEENSSKTTLPIINQKGLKDLKIRCPNVEIQLELLRFIEYCESCLRIGSDLKDMHFKLDARLFEFAQTCFTLFYNQESLEVELKTQQTLLTQLRQSILQEAVQGKLTKKFRETDRGQKFANVEVLDTSPGWTAAKQPETGADLLACIRAEKAELIRQGQGKLRKEKPLPPITDAEKPFELPEGWVWCRLGDVSNFIDYRGKTPNKVTAGVKLITAKNVKFGYFSTMPDEYITKKDYLSFMTRGIPNKGDILFTTEAPLGNACLLNYDEPFGLAQRIITIQPILMSSVYLLNCILSKFIQRQLLEKSSGVTATGIKSSKLIEILIPLPPIVEQQVIVSKVEQLVDQISTLETENKQQQAEVSLLMQAVLSEAFASKKEVVEI